MDAIKVSGIGTVDKAAVAKQIATALVLQGKTGVSGVELEQLTNAVELENQRRLRTKVRLPNGEVVNVFELNIINDAEHWFCKLCQCLVVGLVFCHEFEQSHISNMQNVKICLADLPEVVQNELTPPEIEEVEPVAQIQETLDNYTEGSLIGLEYLIELKHNLNKEPSYLCLLCDKQSVPDTVILHLNNCSHILRYIKLHFSACFCALFAFITKQKCNWQPIIQKIVEGIESNFGRLKPRVANFETITNKREHLKNLVTNGQNLSEESSTIFEELVGDTQLTIKTSNDKPLTKLSDNVSTTSIKLHSETSKEPESTLHPIVEKPEKLKTSTTTEKTYLSRWDRVTPIKSHSVSAFETNKSKSNKFEEFKKVSLAIENCMGRILKQHEANPQKHPQYNDEWIKFSNLRYRELQVEGKDAAAYDLKPEWNEFWKKRMLEIHNAEIELKVDMWRKRLNLPRPIFFKIGKKKKPSEASEVKVGGCSTIGRDADVFINKDYEGTIGTKRFHDLCQTEAVFHSAPFESTEKSHEPSCNLSEDCSNTVTDKSSQDKEYNKDRDLYRKIEPLRVTHDVNIHPVMSSSSNPHVETIESDGDVNIVAILRLLTALEEKLGSLGPTVIQLFAQALKMEKTKPNSSESLLDETNCILLETIQEKFKEQLLVGLVDDNQKNAFKIAIQKITSLLRYSGERKKQFQEKKMPGVDTVDKAAIAKQIATALVLQGRTGVSEAELEQLTNAVVEMAEASKNTDKPMTTANFLQQLSQQKKTETSTRTLTQSLQTVASEPQSSTSMEGLSDLDIQSLLQNFNDLCANEQHNLISYLKKLELKEPERVDRLRKFVVLDTKKRQEPVQTSRRLITNSIILEKVEKSEVVTATLDSDEDEYTFEDVFRMAKQNVQDNEERKRKATLPVFETKDFDLSNPQSLIANIVGQFKSNMSGNNNLLGLGGSVNTIYTPRSEKIITNPLKPNIQSRVDVSNETIMGRNVEPDSRSYCSNIVYPQHNQNVKPLYNQHLINRQNFDQYSMHDYDS
ncbi:hypothetical protein RN001_013246 [Aquatica leii]|uniref:Uncharacterized protein n=1 Tax=Aquatica leii TaxID=1421715 RepID=A0AAN7S6X0_9COLE|nr:hypothetical protein RN001_013246 [Aquatica leii]